MNPSAPVLELAELRFCWPGSPPCLDIPALSLARGERLFLHGPSGSGKSSLLSLVGGVVLPAGGRLELFGVELARLGARARDRFRAEHLGIVFQLFNLLPYLSALENIALACRFSAVRARRAGDVATEARRLAGHLDLPEAVLARPAAELSVGQQQRVAAARALIGRPQLVIADEPTSALDAELQDRFIELLLAECAEAGAALLFVSHDLRLAAHFDRVVELAAINRARPAR